MEIFFKEGKTGLLPSDYKFLRPNFLFSLFSIPLFSTNYFCSCYFQFFWFRWKVRCSVLPVRSSVSKFGHHVRSVRSSVCQSSRCSKFGILMFVPPLILVTIHHTWIYDNNYYSVMIIQQFQIIKLAALSNRLC